MLRPRRAGGIDRGSSSDEGMVPLAVPAAVMECEMDKLDNDQIESRLEALAEWTLNGESLQRTIGFEDFKAAMVFVNKLADAAEKAAHHPDIMIRYGKVTLTLSTHDAGGLTEKDFKMATLVESLLAG